MRQGILPTSSGARDYGLEWLDSLQSVLWSSTLPGGAGGLAWYLAGRKAGRIKNGRYARKAIVEMIGGGLVASFLSFPLGPFPRHVSAFVIGLLWSDILQQIRSKVTKIVEAILNHP